MQRKIKFRAWDKKKNEMLMFDCEPNMNSEYCLLCWGITNKPDFSYGDLDCDDFELMQFTGLKDCEGKEIYEKDILQPKQYLKSNFMRKIVNFMNGMFVLGDNMFSLSESLKKSEQVNNDFVVIGNFFENPELVDVKK